VLKRRRRRGWHESGILATGRQSIVSMKPAAFFASVDLLPMLLDLVQSDSAARAVRPSEPTLAAVGIYFSERTMTLDASGIEYGEPETSLMLVEVAS
jgi:hypothetical protein